MTPLTIGSLFTGYGGLDLAVEAVLDARTVWTSDIDPGARRIIAHRWPDAPNLGDIGAVDWTAVEPVDVITGGFPCQDVSHAGARRGLGPGTRSGLWARMADAIDHLRPQLVVAENVRGLLSAEAASDVEPCTWCLGDGAGEPPLRALGAVLADLAELGYDASWYGLRAADVGAPHGRFRVFVLARPADADLPRLEGAEPAGRHLLPARRHLVPAADADGIGSVRARGARRWGTGPADGTDAPADPDGDALALVGGLDTLGCDTDGRRGADTAWGDYEPAIRRWERALGRPAPAPTEPGRTGAQRLSPRFVEWMMGLPDGWVTQVPGLTRNDQLKALGNGVVPQQAAAALTTLLTWRHGALNAPPLDLLEVAT